ncbi:ribosomal protection-like ABC-F family protein [Acetivibrio sp. MSJd-27]|uniref:ribosomal protection-like ABC-F family protein n=1 Tax=Acetivibrio sp. MSJd-27 TaxID=2841523 RepID=UPI001C111CAA|nr:ABC-F type ribosomal protection protein [Acetivibrio sp. MSJd-27]MBU5449216.1 ABC-F type ribosomal protection protein [Acetivibrio sp. MSJd-27]
MSQITVSNLTFAYEGSYDNIFEGVSFRLDTDWKLGFTGRNGRGKTTFLNLLLGKLEYQGRISSSVDFDYFPFPITNKTQPAIEIARTLNPALEDWELQREASVLGVEEEALSRPFGTLSNGEQTKVLLAILFLKQNHFLLIDEPTNHLDSEARKAVSAYLKSKKGFILVSHDRTFLDGCIDHILSINKTNIEVQKGNFFTWYANKQLQDQFEQAENEKLKNEIKRLYQASKRTAVWSDQLEKTKKGTRSSGLRPDRGYIGHKSAKMMKRSKVLEHRQRSHIEEKTKLLKNIESADDLKISPLNYSKDKLLCLNNISICYGEKTVCRDISFTVSQGDRIVLQGKNGCGKTSILKLIQGENIAYIGDLQKGSNLKISYVSQQTSHLSGSLSGYAEQYGVDESQLKTILRKLDFSRIQLEKNMETFSEGQKKKVLIARSLCEKAHLYIWDEPLNFIDVLSRIQIENLLLSSDLTLLFVEHDKLFAEHVATKFLSF